MFNLKKQEFKKLLMLAIPIMLSQLFQVGMGFTDIVIAGHYSDTVLAAVGLGVSIWHPLLFFAAGVFMSFSVLSSHYYGANQLEKIPSVLRDGIYLVIFFSFIITLIICFPRPILMFFHAEEALTQATTVYLRGLAVGVPAVFLFCTLRSIAEGLSRPMATLVVTALGFIVNAFVNYSLVNGVVSLGIPEFGVFGSGLATGLSFWFVLIAMILCIRVDKRLAQAKIFSQLGWPHWHHIKELIQIGLPNGAAIFAEVTIFSAAGLMLSKFGDITVAGHQIALNLTNVTYMIPLSLSFALTALVGQHMGRKDHVSAVRIAKMGICTSMLFMFFSATFLISLRHYLPYLFTHNPEIIALASYLLVFAAIYQLPDCLQVSVFSVLRGMKDTKIPMYLCIFSYWIVAMPMSYYLGVVLEQKAQGVWIAMIFGLSAAALTMSIRFLFLSRKYS